MINTLSRGQQQQQMPHRVVLTERMKNFEQWIWRGLCALAAIYFLMKIRRLQSDNRSSSIQFTPPMSGPANKMRLGLEPQFCEEDREHVQRVLALNLTKPNTEIIQDLYKLIIKPVQTNCLNMRRIGK